MFFLRIANERGHAIHGWLDCWQTVSVASYSDPDCGGVSARRVIDEEGIGGGAGFGAHP
ncbi:pirin family protein, partial [Escherichia coli]